MAKPDFLVIVTGEELITRIFSAHYTIEEARAAEAQLADLGIFAQVLEVPAADGIIPKSDSTPIKPKRPRGRPRKSTTTPKKTAPPAKPKEKFVSRTQDTAVDPDAHTITLESGQTLVARDADAPLREGGAVS